MERNNIFVSFYQSNKILFTHKDYLSLTSVVWIIPLHTTYSCSVTFKPIIN